jgi:uncharacterized NAD-dependent epimerase/dehydratase family protein
MTRRLVLLAHGGFPDRAKTAVGLLRYSDDEVVAVLDHERAGERVADHLSGVPDAPILAAVGDTPEFDALVVGVAPIGGGFEPAWRPDVLGALRAGADVWAGLHEPLSADEEFATVAADNGAEIWDVREPPADLSVGTGQAGAVDATVVLTVGSDCSTGKMTTTMELCRGANERGVDAAFVPTGQTGVMVAGDGIVIDRTVADFTAGAAERMVLAAAADHEFVFVEGQGAITHPAYSAVTCGLVHGAMPDAMVLCHEAGRERVHGYESFPVADPSRLVGLYEDLAAPVHEGRVVGGALNTSGLERAAADEALDRYEEAVDGPVADPVRDGIGPLLDAVGVDR